MERLDAWLPAAPAAAAAWLREPGLLTERLRACCSGRDRASSSSRRRRRRSRPRMPRCSRAPGSTAFVREIELTCDGRPWVFAQTLVPQATLARQRWLATLGRAALGERLAAVPGLERGPLEFARLVAGDRLYHRALRERTEPPAALWARRSWFAIEGRAPPGAGSVPARVARVSDDPDVAPQARSDSYKPEYEPHPAARALPRARQDARASTRGSCACTGRSASGCSCGRRCGGCGSRARADPMRASS